MSMNLRSVTPAQPVETGVFAAAPGIDWNAPRSATWRTLTHLTAQKKLPKGIDAMWHAAAGYCRAMLPRQRMALEQAQRVCALSPTYEAMSEEQLRGKMQELRAVFRRGRDRSEHRRHAFAAIREAASRRLGMKPYPVQIAAGWVIAEGCVAEAATGEGKTLMATLPAIIAGWRGRGCHVITVNDYLAKRDAELNEPVYRFCGLTAAYIDGEMERPRRRAAYAADVTYGTNKEVTADFLRDRLRLGRVKSLPMILTEKITRGRASAADDLLIRGLECAIVDEADSVLIDEAVTPLIISGDAPNSEQVQTFSDAVRLVAQLQPDDYRVDARYREVELTPRGKERLAELCSKMHGLWRGARRREELATQALTAREIFLKGKQYVIQEGKVVIVDEFTGRLMPDRTWRSGLHQAIEAKEGLEVNPPKETFARLSFQRFFRLYRRLGGMTGTAAEAWPELWQIYKLPVVVIPTHRPRIRKELPDRVFARMSQKWDAVVREIQSVHATGRPILVGTRSVESSEALSERLTALNLPHRVLNAVRHAEEAAIIAEAGQKGRITVATNMAGRGTDIKPGPGVVELGGLHVIATERHEARRVDRQLFGRTGRQGDPGTAVAYVSFEDELIQRYAPKTLRRLARSIGADPHGEISNALARRAFNLAQRRATRFAWRQRKSVVRTDDWLDETLGFAGREI